MTAEVASTPARKTGRPCRACRHPERAEIDRELVAAIIPVSALAERFGISEQSLARHRDRHMPRAALTLAADAAADAEGQRGAAILQTVSGMVQEALSILATAKQAGTLTVALHGIREACRCLELQAKLEGAIDSSATVNITFAPVLIELQQAVLIALQPFPDARAAVVGALARISGPAALPVIEHG